MEAAWGLQAPAQSIVPQGRSGVVVLDLSRSIGIGPSREVRKALRRLDSCAERLGLVVFSDTAYELLPPGSPGCELRAIVRFFTPIEGRRDRNGEPVFPENPWTESFRAGTRISTGLWLGWQALKREKIHNGALMLVSDLATEPDDLRGLVPLLIAMRRKHVELKILALNPKPADRTLFERLAGSGAFVQEAQSVGVGGLGRRFEASLTKPLPWALVGASLLLLLALGANELVNGRLTWRTA